MTPLHQEIGQGQHRRRRKEREETMEGHDMVEKAACAVILQDLPAAGVKEEPAHQHAQEKDDSAIQLRFGHIIGHIKSPTARQRSRSLLAQIARSAEKFWSWRRSAAGRACIITSSARCAFSAEAFCLRRASAAASPNRTFDTRLTG